MYGATTNYDDEFVKQSSDLGRKIHELRIVRDMLSNKRQSLSMQLVELTTSGTDVRAIRVEMTKVMIEWRRCSDKIDELLALQVDHIKSCRVGTDIWDV